MSNVVPFPSPDPDETGEAEDTAEQYRLLEQIDPDPEPA